MLQCSGGADGLGAPLPKAMSLQSPKGHLPLRMLPTHHHPHQCPMKATSAQMGDQGDRRCVPDPGPLWGSHGREGAVGAHQAQGEPALEEEGGKDVQGDLGPLRPKNRGHWLPEASLPPPGQQLGAAPPPSLCLQPTRHSCICFHFPNQRHFMGQRPRPPAAAWTCESVGRGAPPGAGRSPDT